MIFKIIILGAGDHGRVVYDILESEKRHFQVEGYIDLLDNKEIWGHLHAGKPVFGGPDKLEGIFASGIQYAAVAIGDNSIRRKYFEEAEKFGFNIASAVHPQAAVSKNAYVGRGACICAGAAINIGAYLGRGVIVNTGATIDHDCRLGDFAQIAPGVHMAGNITVGDDTFIGTGAIITHPHGGSLAIGKSVTIAAGALVMDDVPDGALVAGPPARKKRALKRKK